MPRYLDQHYAASSVEEINAVYDAWANSYESELEAENYQGAHSVASIFAETVSDRHAHILDVGCGTGLVGQRLSEIGFQHLTGIDLSNGMLQQAAHKRCYRNLQRVDLTQPIPLAEESFDVVTSAGLFTKSLLGPDVLKRVCALTRRDGLVIVGINVLAFDTQDYPAALDEMVRHRDGELVKIRDMPYWPDKGISSRVVVLRL